MAEVPTPPASAADAAKANAPYRVLARKYRPETFVDLIGQEAMVRTLRNAFERGRIAQAYLLTGVRGIGKTTTARIIARALNCIGPDGTGGPTIAPCGHCRHCRDIMDDRDVDVVEMDAASNNSVDNIREIAEAVRYRPAGARYKVYILDEAHMLSNSAFNALLKTLEEPPPHVKFIFATTEARRLPVTVLSRCQRFDLRRVPPADLAAHFKRIAEAEDATVEPEALAMIARAADGSVRDGLSLLDQAIALAEPGQPVTDEQVRAMLGVADRLAAYDLFEAALAGDAIAALAQFEAMFAFGADPAAILQDLMETTYWTTRLGVDPKGVDFAGASAAERDRAAALAARLTLPALTRAWQLLSKGHGEAMGATNPRLSAEMTLIRLAYAANLPTPDDLIRRLEAGEGVAGAGPSSAAAPAGGAGPAAGQAPPERAASARPMPAAQSVLASARESFGGAGRALQASEPVPFRPPEPVDPAAARVRPAPPVLAPAAVSLPPAPTSVAAPAPTPGEFPDFEALFAHLKVLGAPVALTLLRQLRLVAYEPGRIVYEAHDGLRDDYRKRLREELSRATNRVWAVEPSADPGRPSLADAEAAADAALRAHPLVQAALAAFPDGTLVIGRPAEPTLETPVDDAAPPPLLADGAEPPSDENPDVVYDDDVHFGDWEPDD